LTAALHIGTSGWSYDHWHGPLYPPELPPAARLAYYAGRLASAEIDSGFYKGTSKNALRGIFRDAKRKRGFRFAPFFKRLGA